MRGQVLVLCALLLATFSGAARVAWAETEGAEHESNPAVTSSHPQNDEGHDGAAHGGAAHGKDAHGAGHGSSKEPKGTFDAHAGTWFNGIARSFFPAAPAPDFHRNEKGEIIRDNGEAHLVNAKAVRYDYIAVAFFLMSLLGLTATLAAKKARIRPEGKPHSLPNLFEAAVEGYRNYLVGVMGRDLAFKYAPLIASFFFCILLFNWTGLIPGMIAPTANPNTTLALALVAFVATHFIAIKEVGFKSWAMHFVGEPKWLFWLNIPLHLMGELVKPLALAIRLLCNLFGEEMVIYKLATIAVAAMAVTIIPLPFQFPIMMLGILFG